MVLDAAAGVLEMAVTPELRNPAGTLQGAMVALFAEAAAEETPSARFSTPAVVTEFDLRYLAQTGEGPVQSRCTVLGEGPDAPVRVELSDRSTGRLTTLVYARTATIPVRTDTAGHAGERSSPLVAKGLVNGHRVHVKAPGSNRGSAVSGFIGLAAARARRLPASVWSSMTFTCAVAARGVPSRSEDAARCSSCRFSRRRRRGPPRDVGTSPWPMAQSLGAGLAAIAALCPPGSIAWSGSGR